MGGVSLPIVRRSFFSDEFLFPVGCGEPSAHTVFFSLSSRLFAFFDEDFASPSLQSLWLSLHLFASNLFQSASDSLPFSVTARVANLPMDLLITSFAVFLSEAC